jgi:hypothetical protein
MGQRTFQSVNKADFPQKNNTGQKFILSLKLTPFLLVGALSGVYLEVTMGVVFTPS